MKRTFFARMQFLLLLQWGSNVLATTVTPDDSAQSFPQRLEPLAQQEPQLLQQEHDSDLSSLSSSWNQLYEENVPKRHFAGSNTHRSLETIATLLSNHATMDRLVSLVADPAINNLLNTTDLNLTALIPLDLAFVVALPATLLDNLLSSSSSLWNAHRWDLVANHFCTDTHLAVPNRGPVSSTTTTNLTMVNGQTVQVVMSNRNDIQMNGIVAVSAMEADNGSVFYLARPLPLPWYDQTVLDVAGSVEFTNLVIAAGMEDLLRNPNQVLTVLAPSPSSLETIVDWATPEHLQRIVQYHVVPNQILSWEELALGVTRVTNLLGFDLVLEKTIRRNVDNAVPTITLQGQALQRSHQHLALNGVVHRIPEILRTDYAPS